MKTFSLILLIVGTIFLVIGLILLALDNGVGIRFYILTSIILNSAGLLVRSFSKKNNDK